MANYLAKVLPQADHATMNLEDKLTETGEKVQVYKKLFESEYQQSQMYVCIFVAVGARGKVCHIFSLTWPHKRPKVSLLLVYNWIPKFPSVKTYISFSLQHLYALLAYTLLNGCVRYADHKT